MVSNWIELTGFLNGYRINADTFVIERMRDCYRPCESISAEGYMMITLNGIRLSKHRIIAEVFIPNPNNLPEVDHIDGNRQNNSLNNLRWVTRSENARNRAKRVITEREYVEVDKERLDPIWVPGIELPTNTYYYSQEHNAVVKRGVGGRWFTLSIHQRGGINRINLRDAAGHNRMVTLSHVRY